MALELPHDLHLMVGFELEFVLLKPVQPQAAAANGGHVGGGESHALQLTSGLSSYLPVDDSIYCQSLAFDQLAPGRWQQGQLAASWDSWQVSCDAVRSM